MSASTMDLRRSHAGIYCRQRCGAEQRAQRDTWLTGVLSGQANPKTPRSRGKAQSRGGWLSAVYGIPPKDDFAMEDGQLSFRAAPSMETSEAQLSFRAAPSSSPLRSRPQLYVAGYPNNAPTSLTPRTWNQQAAAQARNIPPRPEQSVDLHRDHPAKLQDAPLTLEHYDKPTAAVSHVTPAEASVHVESAATVELSETASSPFSRLMVTKPTHAGAQPQAHPQLPEKELEVAEPIKEKLPRSRSQPVKKELAMTAGAHGLGRALHGELRGLERDVNELTRDLESLKSQLLAM